MRYDRNNLIVLMKSDLANYPCRKYNDESFTNNELSKKDKQIIDSSKYKKCNGCGGNMSAEEKERERLKAKEQQKNPGSTLNNTWAQATTGAPSGSCLINIISFIMIIVFVFLIRACSN
ncbi:hypothetical protein H7992_13315 [Sporosarcina sp. resist]|uniref:hypothetical protein n=1 Tax=Sporosarcina TaxID=1569 RepID=UPI00164DBAA9|nr:hypothetical protein [Sporosarcina sp. resist]QNK86252.1 hypothetical protein H7992_13315 [Sporosarcina sp. resist]